VMIDECHSYVWLLARLAFLLTLLLLVLAPS